MENAKSKEFVNQPVKDIPNTDGKYAVSADGLVLRFKAKKWNCIKGEIICGYRRVNLSLGKVVKRARVHRLVAQAFIENPLNKPFVNHKDGNKLNNCVENLEWCTSSENEHHSYNVLGKVAWKTKPEHIRLKTYEMRKSGVKVRDICNTLNVSKSFVERLMRAHSQTK